MNIKEPGFNPKESDDIRTIKNSSEDEADLEMIFLNILKCPIPRNEFLKNLGLFLYRQTLMKH